MKARVKLIFILAIISACSTLKTNNSQNSGDAVLYQASIQNAIYPEESKVSDHLIPIVKENKNLVWKTFDGEDYLLVVSWKGTDSYYRPYLDSAFYNTGAYEIWVSTAPELLKRMKKENPVDTDKRLKQLLGLPPNSEYNYFIEFWVKPEDLFRPCPDKEITDEKCETCFPVQTDSVHIEWINENRISRYYQCNLYDQYPWTQLGYTYDWNPKNKSHVGLSEFVIGKNKNIKVNAIYDTEEYLHH